MKKFTTGIALLATLSGCASIVSGSSQEIQLKANPAVPVKCEAQNDRGLYTSNDQPGMLLVKRSQSRLNITCNGGGYTGKYSEQAGAEAWTFGNVILGGLIGLTIDGITGAMFSYDNALLIPVTLNDPFAQSGTPAPAAAIVPAAPGATPAPVSYDELMKNGAIVEAPKK